MRTWWNRAFLNKYLERGLIPRGLRVQVFPSFEVDDEVFRKRWEELADTCSRGFMGLLSQLNQVAIEGMDKEIDEIQTKLQQDVPSETLSAFNTELEQEFTKWEKNISENKAKKFQRDIGDLQTNTVYKWNRKTYRSRGSSRARSASTISLASSEESIKTRPRYYDLRNSGLNREKKSERPKNTNNYQQNNKKIKKGLEVINLSSHTLTGDQITVLQKGLTFSPTNNFDVFTATKDVYLFARKLILKKLYAKDGHESTSDKVEREAQQALEDLLSEQTVKSTGTFPSNCYPRSTRFPPLSLCPAVEIFTRLVIEDFQKIPTRRQFDNLTSKQRQALDELKNYDDIVIKPADKGGNIVLWPKTLYEKEAMRHLRDRVTYQRLDYNPLHKFTLELEAILEDAFEQGIIPKKIYEGLLTKFPKIPTLYFIPKIHKNPIDPPGRPIVSGMGGVNDPVCKFVDFYLKPLVESLPSYARDTSDVLSRINGIQLDEDMILVTADIESLYTCIRHDDGLEAVRFFLGSGNLDGPIVITCVRDVVMGCE
ncbi:uncharacterized protein LOC143774874 [Ranitomeya variabilis]|uniref:uncharacterized protein LOC143774874 n=1 Tax=Ranitomeya variabilis TaxID=490064 RepID=UPI004055E939